MTKKDYIAFHAEFCKSMVDITARKNHDYTGAGDDAFANFRQIASLMGSDQLGNVAGTGPVDVVAIGFLTRMSDKLSRIGSFVAKGELLVKEESVEDTLKDLANYSALFAGYLRGVAAENKKQRAEAMERERAAPRVMEAAAPDDDRSSLESPAPEQYQPKKFPRRP